ncbi:MAG: hypothetical protein P1V51_21990 [Deltaproteobacteria bacterium]|nr:hypothetical protein [Deltaproteobacteria bacterium]
MTGLPGCTLLTPSNAEGGSTTCRDDLDCPASTPLCRQYECVSRCSGVVCSGDGSERCDLGTGQCVPYLGEPCALDAQCPAGRPRCVAGNCRGDRLDECGAAPCVPGLSCVPVRGVERCLQPCGDAPCQVGERCLDASFGALAAYCAPNLCRPGGGPEDTLIRAAAYGEGCPTDGHLEGICLGPLPDATLGDVGLCLAPGLAPAGQSCDPAAVAGSAQACFGGICSRVEGEPAGTCFQLCSVWESGSCPAGQACHPQWGSLGVCFDLQPDAAPAGSACQRPLDGLELACEQGSICLPEDLGGGATRCLPVCDPDAAKAETEACAEGRCERWDPTGNPFLGVCAAL